jgi:hypothetical protein
MSMEGQLCGMPLAGPESFSSEQLAYLKRALGADETVLWEGTSEMSGNPSITLSESAQNFKFIDIYSLPHNSNTQPIVTRVSVGDGITGTTPGTSFTVIGHASGTGVRFNNSKLLLSGTTASFTEQKQFSIVGTTVSTANCSNSITKIVGIHRIAGGNT